MSTLDQVFEQIKPLKQPPVDRWQPSTRSELDIRIATDGQWFYRGSIIQRQRMVNLFSTLLRLDCDAQFYLITPSVKYRIKVEDAPFVAVELKQQGAGMNQQLYFRTNVDTVVLADAQHPIEVIFDPDSGEPSPYVVVRENLKAKITRPVFYELTELLQPAGSAKAADRAGRLAEKKERDWGLYSGGTYFSFGKIE